MSSNPSITATIIDVNPDTIALTGDESVLIRYRSNAQATMRVTVYGEAVLNEDMCIIRNGGDTGYGKSYTFNNVESQTFVFSAEDSQGRIGTKTVNVSMIPYFEPTCYMSNNKPNADGSMRLECYGDFYNGSFGARSNTLTAKYRYKKSGGSFGSWKSMTVSKSGNTYTAYANLTGLDYKTSYSFEVQAEDELTIAGGSESGVSSLPVFHWGSTDFDFEVPVSFNAGFDIKEGANANFGKATLVHNGATGYLSQHGLWIPTLLYESAVYSYTLQMGWYSKTGIAVTVGFFIKADCYDGYEEEDIVIGGLPFTPTEYSASGGGICSGTYVPITHTFQCFVAEKNVKEITIRVQECDRVYDGNLYTSKSGCRYPYGGGEITLSGTITYITME